MNNINITIYTSSTPHTYLGNFHSKGVIPNKGDIIVVEGDEFEVVKRKINYSSNFVTIDLYVEDWFEVC